MERITDAVLDPRAVEALVAAPSMGAVLTFSGVARDNFGGRPVHALEYEAYPELAIPVMVDIEDEVARRWPGARVAMVHRLSLIHI